MESIKFELFLPKQFAIIINMNTEQYILYHKFTNRKAAANEYRTRKPTK